MTSVSRRNHQCGFTLIEVVVAFAIFALCLGALYETFAGATRRSVQARDQEIAWLLAQSVLAEVRGMAIPEPQASGKAQELEWRVEIIPYEAGAAAGAHWQPYEVTVRVSSQSRKRQAYELRSIEWFRAQP